MSYIDKYIIFHVQGDFSSNYRQKKTLVYNKSYLFFILFFSMNSYHDKSKKNVVTFIDVRKCIPLKKHVEVEQQ